MADIKEYPSNPRGVCPYCGTYGNFTIGGDCYEQIEGRSINHQLLRCTVPVCERVNYRASLIAQPVEGMPSLWIEAIVAQWPAASMKAVSKDLPDPIAADAAEAELCSAVGAFKAAAALARRAVQGVMLNKGANPERALWKQIDELVASGALEKSLGEWAHEIRYFGNDGAHPGEDGLEVVTKEEAQQAIDFLRQLLQWVYVMPKELERSRAARGKT